MARPDQDDRARVDQGAAGMNQGMRVLSYLISGVVVYGLLGWLGDHLLHTHFLLPVGIIAGAALGIYMVIKRFGQVGGTDQPTTTDHTTTNKTEGLT